MTDATKTWKQWVIDFKHGRTHTAYGLIASIISSGYILTTTSSIPIRIASLISFAGSLGGLVDTVAHLYYH
jgi:hypothetical protein